MPPSNKMKISRIINTHFKRVCKERNTLEHVPVRVGIYVTYVCCRIVQSGTGAEYDVVHKKAIINQTIVL
jgi:hypothetical protein